MGLTIEDALLGHTKKNTPKTDNDKIIQGVCPDCNKKFRIIDDIRVCETCKKAYEILGRTPCEIEDYFDNNNSNNTLKCTQCQLRPKSIATMCVYKHMCNESTNWYYFLKEK